MSESNTLEILVEFPSENGETDTRVLNFKPLTLVPIGLIRETRHDNNEQMWAVFEWAFPADDLATFDALPSTKLFDILAEMQKVSNIELGE